MLSIVWSIGIAISLMSMNEMVPDEPASSLLHTELTIRVPGTTIPFTMRLCEGGSITIDEKQGKIAVPESYVLATEITWDLYDIYVYELDETDGTSEADAVSRPSKPYIPPDRGFGHEGYPAIGMTYEAANGFCEWLSLKTGLTFRLPTSAEWMYFALAGADQEYCCDTDQHSLGHIAWFEENSERTTHPVGLKDPNGFGLFDVHGNAAEWVVTDSRKPIAMGGSYRDSAADCTASSEQKQHRSWNTSDPQIPKSSWWLADCSWVGFRFVIETDTIDHSILKELIHE